MYHDYVQEEVYEGKNNEHKAAIIGEATLAIAAKHKQTEGDQCAICLNEMADRQKIKRLPSYHIRTCFAQKIFF
jgi:hypothetical protein